MDKYTVLCKSVTGVNNKILLQDNSYPESDFVNLNDHISSQAISKYVEAPAATKPTKEAITKESCY